QVQTEREYSALTDACNCSQTISKPLLQTGQKGFVIQRFYSRDLVFLQRPDQGSSMFIVQIRQRQHCQRSCIRKTFKSPAITWLFKCNVGNQGVLAVGLAFDGDPQLFG